MSVTSLEERTTATASEHVAGLEADLPRLLITSVRIGLLGGVGVVSIALQGMVVAFNDRYVINDLVVLGHLMILMALFICGFAASRSAKSGMLATVLTGGLAGTVASALLVLLIGLAWGFRRSRASDERSGLRARDDVLLGFMLLIAIALATFFVYLLVILEGK